MGWTVIWMNDMSDLDKVDHSTVWLAALSPKRLFHPNVKYAMYLADPVHLLPSVDDVLFLTSQMWRRAQTAQKVKQSIGLVKSDKELPISFEPERKVGLLVGALRMGGPEDLISISPWKHEVSWANAMNKMSFEIYGNDTYTETESLKSQRESYERVQGYVNSPQLRSAYEPPYKYAVYHCKFELKFFSVFDYKTGSIILSFINCNRARGQNSLDDA
jgi:hypothetical protein